LLSNTAREEEVLHLQSVLKNRVLFTAVALLATVSGIAQARSGRAAYHYHSGAMITASRYEPVGSVLRVTNPENGRSVTVRVTGSGPFNGNRILDLSTGAFSQLYGGTGRGVGPVTYEVISRGGGSGARLAARSGYKRGWKKNRKASKSRRSYRSRSHR
jgi:rare lipoprotein A